MRGQDAPHRGGAGHRGRRRPAGLSWPSAAAPDSQSTGIPRRAAPVASVRRAVVTPAAGGPGDQQGPDVLPSAQPTGPASSPPSPTGTQSRLGDAAVADDFVELTAAEPDGQRPDHQPVRSVGGAAATCSSAIATCTSGPAVPEAGATGGARRLAEQHDRAERRRAPVVPGPRAAGDGQPDPAFADRDRRSCSGCRSRSRSPADPAAAATGSRPSTASAIGGPGAPARRSISAESRPNRRSTRLGSVRSSRVEVAGQSVSAARPVPGVDQHQFGTVRGLRGRPPAQQAGAPAARRPDGQQRLGRHLPRPLLLLVRQVEQAEVARLGQPQPGRQRWQPGRGRAHRCASGRGRDQGVQPAGPRPGRSAARRRGVPGSWCGSPMSRAGHGTAPATPDRDAAGPCRAGRWAGELHPAGRARRAIRSRPPPAGRSGCRCSPVRRG